MAIETDVYFLYELSQDESFSNTAMILLKALRPAWRNAIEPEGEWAEDDMEKKRDEMLKQCLARTENKHARLIGRFEGWPEGDVFYEDKGGYPVTFWFAASGYGAPWLVFSQAESEEQFWQIINDDEFLANMRPLPPAKQQTAIFFTENDFDLTQNVNNK